MPIPPNSPLAAAAPTGVDRNAWALSGPALWIRTLVVFGLALGLFAFLYGPSPLIYDADSYFHLAIARDYGRQGVSSELEAVRFGLLAKQFGDKEFLFHALLVPFAAWMDPIVGGRVALALLGAAILSVIGHLSMRAIGGWGMIIPFWLAVGSMELIWRLVRLRAELLSVLLVLLALWLAVCRRYRLLGVLAVLYALAYTAVHAFVGLFLLVFLAQGWALRRWDLRLVVYPLLGAGIGLLIHPQFPDNLAVWWFQSIEYFRFRGALDVGSEIQPMRTDVVLIANLGWLLGLVLIWRASERRGGEQAGEASVAFGVGALVFGVLYLLMSRFALYWVALATLWLLFEIRRQGREFTSRVRLPGGRSLALGLAWGLCLLASLPIAGYDLQRYRERNSAGPDEVRLTDRQRLAAALPDGAHVAATWRSTPIYMFWAPQGRYLNVLDPVFLAAVDPPAHRAQEEIFSGVEPDVPLRAVAELDSRYIAYSGATASETLSRRLLADPRARLLHRQINVLFELRPPAGEPFVLDWHVAPSGTRLPPSTDTRVAEWPAYPRLSDPMLASMEGFVDARRVAGPEDCLGLVHVVEGDRSRSTRLEFAPAGPSILWLDQRQLLRLQGDSDAVLGAGALLPLELAAGEQRITVLTCPESRHRRSGFYLVEREGP